MGFGWKSRYGTGKGKDTITGGPEVTWSTTPTKWSNSFFENLFKYEWELEKSPAGANQFRAKGAAATIPDAFDPSKRHTPTMLVNGRRFADGSGLREDFPALLRASGLNSRMRLPAVVSNSPTVTWARGARYLGPEVPAEELIWQDPVPAVDHKLIDAKDIADLKAKILASGLSISKLVATALGRGGSFRGSDKRGGANGARLRLSPRRIGKSTSLPNLATVLETLKGIQKAFQPRGQLVARKCRSRSDRPRRLGRYRASREKGGARRDGSLRAGPHRRLARPNQCGILCLSRTVRGRVPQLPSRLSTAYRRRSC